MFRIAFAPPEQLDTMDPAIANSQASWLLLDTTCARLMTYPDKPPPRAYRPVPEVAVAPPKISGDGKRYTFALRHDFRFSDGKPVRADAFAHAINRTLATGGRSIGTRYMEDILGARAVQRGRASSARGVIAGGYRLVIRLKQPLGDFAERTTMPFFCAVPPTLPTTDPEGRGEFAGSGPYYVQEYRPGQRIIIRRNRYYRGTRPHHVDGFSVDLTASSPQEVLDRIEDGRADWGIAPPPIYFEQEPRLEQKYGLKGQFRVRPGFTFRGFVLNTARPLFRDNLSLRKAVNLAVDRQAFGAGGNLGTRATDQYLPPNLPDFDDATIYPLRTANLRRARKLARGHLRGGKAVLYIQAQPLTLGLGQKIRQQLARIGLDVDVQPIPATAYATLLSTPGERYDMAFLVTPSVDYYDPYAFLNLFFESRFIGRTGLNYSNLHSAKYDRRLRAASRLRGRARLRAYGRLDVELARDVAPIVAMAYITEPTLVSKRVAPGCILLRPALDLTAVCLKRS